MDGVVLYRERFPDLLETWQDRRTERDCVRCAVRRVLHTDSVAVVKAWEAAAWLCAAIVVGQSAIELHDAYKAGKAAPAKTVIVKPVAYDTGLWQQTNTEAVAECKATVEAIGLKAGLTHEEMRSDALRAVVGRAVQKCIMVNGLSV